MKGITLYPEEVKALQENGKVQIRRAIKPQPEFIEGSKRIAGTDIWRGHPVYWEADEGPGRLMARYCPLGQVGDKLWVKETWKPSLTVYHYTGEGHGSPSDPCVGYRATMTYSCGKAIPEYPNRWRASVTMPRWASRFDLEVMEVRVERLKDITEEGAQAAGITDSDCRVNNSEYEEIRGWGDNSYTEPFQRLWDFYNPKHKWETNPWVWALELKNIKEVKK